MLRSQGTQTQAYYNTSTIIHAFGVHMLRFVISVNYIHVYTRMCIGTLYIQMAIPRSRCVATVHTNTLLNVHANTLLNNYTRCSVDVWYVRIDFSRGFWYGT